MEPPAVTSSVGSSHASSSSGAAGSNGGLQHSQTPKRENLPVGFLQIEPQISFNATPSRHFEELPENFLETISPQQQQHAGSGLDGDSSGSLQNSIQIGSLEDGGRGGVTTTLGPKLASLTTVSIAGDGSSTTPGSSGYANLISMPTSSYISTLKMESMDHLSATSHHPLHSTSQIEKTTFGNGTAAGLLSPLQLESNRNMDNSALGILATSSVVLGHHHHRPNGASRTSDLLSGIRRSSNNVSYIKEEEINPSEMGGGYQPSSHDYDGYAIGAGQPTPQELERMANAETPPALSNVEITSSILASLQREAQSSPQPPTHFIVHQMPLSRQQPLPPQKMLQMPPSPQQKPRQQSLQPFENAVNSYQHHLVLNCAATPPAILPPPSMPAPKRSRLKASQNQQRLLQQQQQLQQLESVVVDHHLAAAAEAAGSSAEALNIDAYAQLIGAEAVSGNVSPTSYHLSAANDPLNAEIDDEIYIDTKDLCKRVAYELKQHSIPQAIFAERILCRSQGTLSDLLRNPKPWNRLKSGRETFKRMYNWLQQPLHIRLSILDMYKGPMPFGVIPPPTPAQNSRHHHRRRTSTGDDGQPLKRPRLVFTDIQKRTLQAIFKETQRPSREMQQTIAEHLRLDMSTVSNFFMNARRRSRNGNGLGCDEPAPYQQIRTITPPPDSPPSDQQMLIEDQEQQIHHNAIHTQHNHSHLRAQHSRRSTKKNTPRSASVPSSASNLSLIEQTVEEVICRSIAYARRGESMCGIGEEEEEEEDIDEEMSL